MTLTSEQFYLYNNNFYTKQQIRPNELNYIGNIYENGGKKEIVIYMPIDLIEGEEDMQIYPIKKTNNNKIKCEIILNEKISINGLEFENNESEV